MAVPVPFRLLSGDEKEAPDASPRPKLGEALVATGAVTRGSVDRALARQKEMEAPLGHILLIEEALTPDELAAGLAIQADLPVVDLAASPPDSRLLAGLDPYRCLELGAMPWREVDGTRIIAISRPDLAEAAMRALGGDAAHTATVVTKDGDIRRAITSHFSDELRDGARLRCPPAYSCRDLASPGSRTLGLMAAIILTGLAVTAPLATAGMIMIWVVIMNSATSALRLFALFARLKKDRREATAELPHLADSVRLPTVSLLVPLKGEAAVAGGLIRALRDLDYPKALLDIKIILEEEDLPTRMAVDQASLPGWFEIITVPKDAALQTKPRAMNFALPYCRGSIIGIYDAEDRPDPDQIRAVVRALSRAPADVACVQGHLDFYNPDQNWLARCFTIEYAIWFRVVLHGVQRLGIPIPLGGTTVFFRRQALEEVGGWDAHNVTEDADLGMRLARFGYRCEMIRSVTLEEANCRPWRWIGQRSRWLKGYAITWTTHMRTPRALLRDLGWRGFLGFQVLFLGGMTSYLALPLFWVIWFATFFGFGMQEILPASLFWPFAVSMLTGQAIMVTVAAIALRDSGRIRMLPWVLVLPIYWPLGAIAAYRAIAEFFTRPFYWSKTEHGLAEKTP